MSNIAISIQDKNGKLFATDNGNYAVNLVYTAKYKKGDAITLTAKPGSFLVIQLDDVLAPSFVYMNSNNHTRRQKQINLKRISVKLHFISVNHIYLMF